MKIDWVECGKEIRQKALDKFIAKAELCFDNAGTMHDLAVEEFLSSRYEQAAIAEIMAIKMYAAKKMELAEARVIYDKACSYLDWMRGTFTINGEVYQYDFVDRVVSSKEGFAALLLSAVTYSPYLLLGSCYFSWRATQFLSYNIPFSHLINTRENWKADRILAPDFTTNQETARLIPFVGYIFAAVNCPKQFSIPWSNEEKKMELLKPLDWNVF